MTNYITSTESESYEAADLARIALQAAIDAVDAYQARNGVCDAPFRVSLSVDNGQAVYDMFRGRIALNELALIADYVDPAAVCPTTIPVSDQVYETCETVKRMAENLDRMEKDLGEKYKSFVAEAERADRAEAKVAELRRVIQEMVELCSDHIDTANESLIKELDNSEHWTRER